MFNMSHAQGRALIAVSMGQEVGVDLERIRQGVEVDKLSERYFASSEHALIMQLAQEDRAAKFFRFWVAKEAVLKAQGIGLQALHQCEILLGTERADAEVLVPEGSPLHRNWRVRLLSCGEGWEAAVAAQGADWVVQCGQHRSRIAQRLSDAGFLEGFFHSPRSIVMANGPHEVLSVPPRLFARCGLAGRDF
jgi:4'-phosphopantetheinyl transferase